MWDRAPPPNDLRAGNANTKREETQDLGTMDIRVKCSEKDVDYGVDSDRVDSVKGIGMTTGEVCILEGTKLGKFQIFLRGARTVTSLFDTVFVASHSVKFYRLKARAGKRRVCNACPVIF